MEEYRRLEDLVVYQKLRRLHIDIESEEAASYNVNPPGFTEL